MPLRWRVTLSSTRAPATTARRDHSVYARLCGDELHEPLTGVTGHIIPWNHPMQIFGRSVGGAHRRQQCMRGETCRGRLPVPVAHRRTGGLNAAFRMEPRTLSPASAATAGQALADAAGIDHISFTGSARRRPSLHRVPPKHVPVTLELGGKSRRSFCRRQSRRRCR